MTERKKFLVSLSKKNPRRIGQTIALLWFYTYTQEYEERSVADLISDLNDDGFGSVNIIRLDRELRKSRFIVRGSRSGTFKINAAKLLELNNLYGDLISIPNLPVSGSIFTLALINKVPRVNLQKIFHQINGCYDYGFFDSSLVMIRRLSEILIIQTFIFNGKTNDIKDGNGNFFMLDDLIKKINSDLQICVSRNFKKDIILIKDLGDTAAHDRFYISKKEDLQENVHKFRRSIEELLSLSGIY